VNSYVTRGRLAFAEVIRPYYDAPFSIGESDQMASGSSDIAVARA